MAASHHPEISATELELKRRGRRRLIGAVTIGLLAIVFLPMIFDREPKRAGQVTRTQDISVQVPSKEGQPALPAPAVTPVVVPAPVAIDVPKVAVAPEADKPAAVAAPPAVKEAVKVAPKPIVQTEKSAKTEAKPTAGNTGFVVQLGVFSDADNTRQIIAKMKEAKLTVHTENIPIKSGNATRVRVGPYATRDKAEAALAQVKLAGADGKIVPLN